MKTQKVKVKKKASLSKKKRKRGDFNRVRKGLKNKIARRIS